MYFHVSSSNHILKKNYFLYIIFIFIYTAHHLNASNIDLFIQMDTQSISLQMDKSCITHFHNVSKERNYHSQVYKVHISEKDCQQLHGDWILKYCKGNEIEIFAERIAYLISKELQLEIVPQTFLVYYNGYIGVIQRFVTNTVKKIDYKKKLAEKNLKIQNLKTFWFIIGQWDIGNENILFDENKNPTAIDNGAIVYFNDISKYGNIPFMKCGSSIRIANTADIETPIKINGKSGEDIIKILESKDLDIIIDKNIKNRIKNRKWFDLTFYIKDFNVYFQLEDTAKNYFIKNNNDLNITQFQPLAGKLYNDIFSKTKQELQSIILNNKIDIQVDTTSLEKRIDTFYEMLETRINRRLHLIQEAKVT